MTTEAAKVAGKQPHGVDVSNHNGNIDWKKVKAAGIDFAFIKQSEGLSFVDPYARRNVVGCKSAGVLPGRYHYFTPGLDPVMQADYFLKQTGPIGKGELQPVVDVEENDKGMIKPAEMVREVKLFIDRVVAKSGRDVTIYTYPDFWIHAMANADMTAHPLWIATYGPAPAQIGAWKQHWSFWQYDDHGHVPGIAGEVDLDVFNGTLAQLQKFAGL